MPCDIDCLPYLHLEAGARTQQPLYWGDGKWEDLSNPQALHEAKLLKLNCDKAHAELHWHSVLTIDECLQMTADWYKEFYSGTQTKDMHKFCVAQIRKYEEAAPLNHR